MKKILYFLFLSVLMFCADCSPDKDTLNPSDEGTHILQGFTDYGGSFREYKFKNVPANLDFIPAFPADAVDDLPDSIKNKATIEYWLYSSINDAEMSMVEHLELSNLFMKNIIAFPLLGGPIGDNCWYQFDVGAIKFLRNNVLVSVTSGWDSPADSSQLELITRNIDAAIINVEKFSSSEMIPAPLIHSIDVVSDPPET
jgi:hypothetical protein